MTSRPSPDHRVAAGRGALVVAGGTWAWWVSATAPFSTGGDLAAGTGLGLLVLAWAAPGPRHRRDTARGVPRAPLRCRDEQWSGGSRGPAGGGGSGGSAVLWWVALGGLGVVELVSYFAGWSLGRHEFPTASSLYDAAARYRWAKALVGVAWLSIGATMVRRR